jgi:hypothetical protein
VIVEERNGVLSQRREAESSTDRGCPAEMIQLFQFRRYLTQRDHSIGLREKEQQLLVEAQRIKMLEARRQHQLLHQLRAKQFKAWQTAGDKEQEALAAELFLARRKPPQAGNDSVIR